MGSHKGLGMRGNMVNHRIPPFPGALKGEEMKKRIKGPFWRMFLILFIAGAALLVGYLLGVEKGSQEREGRVLRKIPEKSENVQSVRKEGPSEKEVDKKEKIQGLPLSDREESCEEMEKQILEFFTYLDTQGYIRNLEEGMNTYDRFRNLLGILSSHLPIPAGEGDSVNMLLGNIYYFSRILTKTDIGMMKDIMHHEAETLEPSLHLFYQWLMAAERCPDPEALRPAREILYHYSGFFINTIGGRAYLFRRAPGVRLLMTYYCLLILHDADKNGKNSYGIDIFPEVTQALKEISLYPDFQFQEDYLYRLTLIQNYYLEKR